jgi:hypothetical protein
MRNTVTGQERNQAVLDLAKKIVQLLEEEEIGDSAPIGKAKVGSGTSLESRVAKPILKIVV